MHSSSKPGVQASRSAKKAGATPSRPTTRPKSTMSITPSGTSHVSLGTTRAGSLTFRRVRLRHDLRLRSDGHWSRVRRRKRDELSILKCQACPQVVGGIRRATRRHFSLSTRSGSCWTARWRRQPPPDSVPGRSLIAFCQAHDLLRLLAHAGLWGSLRSRRLDAACLRSGLGGSKWCARSMPHSRERSHPRRASRLDAFRRAAGQQCILVLRITPSWPPGRACWCATSHCVR